MSLPFSHASQTAACLERKVPIMRCKRSRALRGRQTRDERNAWKVTMRNLGVKRRARESTKDNRGDASPRKRETSFSVELTRRKMDCEN
ncbi:hypothetical protein TNCV_4379801 [Trichonephila clavipes]|nr:hypothetical protein TNCV_4379801 [Trichonephila clavipes]